MENGEVAWSKPAGKMSYASVQTIDVLGTTYLALLSELGLHLYKPDSGEVVLDYPWQHSGYRALQPQVVDGDKILIPTGLGSGTRLVQASMKDNKLQLEEVWTSLDMKPDFNDILVHKGHIYGFDNNIFGCISLEDGKRKWKGGRYEKGQAILLADSDLIIVVSERGELVLLASDARQTARARQDSCDEGQDLEPSRRRGKSTLRSQCGRGDLLRTRHSRVAPAHG